MKKTLFAIAAMVAMVACNNDYVVKETAQEAIGFDNMFVDNSTRSVNDPSFTNGNLFANFGVFGTVEGAELFNNKTVTGSGWTYEGTQYWIAGAKYNFAAVAPQTVKVNDVDTPVYTNASYAVSSAVVEGKTVYSGTTTLSFVNNGKTDLLYAEAVAEGQAENNSKVAFTFRHVLSKVKFSFENAYNASNAKIRVENVTINNAYKSGVATLNSSTAWVPSDPTLILSFGNAVADDAASTAALAFANGETLESYNELFMIPGQSASDYTVGETPYNDVYEVTFDVVLLVSDQEIDTYTHTIYTTFAPVAGHSYDLKAVINPENIDPEHAQEAIEFTVTAIENWDTTSENQNI